MATKITPTNESPEEVNVPLDKNYSCSDCLDSGELGDPQWDSDSHQYVNTGDTKPCHCVIESKMDNRANEDNSEPEYV